MFKTVLDMTISGGPVMIPIIIVSLIVWTLIFQKQYNLKLENIDADNITDKVIKLLEDRKENEAIKLCSARGGLMSGIIKLLVASKAKTKESLLKLVHETISGEYPKLEQHLSTISTMAAISPLLGLLGTVTGMIATFNSITLYGTSDPHMLAQGIAEAMITTQAGLSVAIPTMFAYNHLAKKVDSIISGVEKNTIKLINILAKD